MMKAYTITVVLQTVINSLETLFECVLTVKNI
jgi:hypothetical protein